MNKKKTIDAVSSIGCLVFLFAFINTGIWCNLIIVFVCMISLLLNRLPEDD